MTETPMTEPWLTIIGVGDNGLESLTPEAQSIVWQTETLVLGERLDAVIDGSALPALKRILNWSGGFRETLREVLKLRGSPVTILATSSPTPGPSMNPCPHIPPATMNPFGESMVSTIGNPSGVMG